MAKRLTIPAGEVRPQQDHLDLGLKESFKILGTITGEHSPNIQIKIDRDLHNTFRYLKTDRVKVIRYNNF